MARRSDNTVLGEPLSVQEAQTFSQAALDELDAFCVSYGIPYFLIGGALIGAVRQKSLLPWDDDIDVAMKRADYERFCREYADSDRYKLLTVKRSMAYRHTMAKLIDCTTVFTEPGARDGALGLGVDIFPLDEVRGPDDAFVSRIALETRIYTYAHVINANATRGSALKSAIRMLLRATVGLGSHRKMFARIESAIVAEKGGHLINHFGAWGKRECVPAHCFESSVPVELGGKLYPAPVGYDEWLTSVYGDYLQPPSTPPHHHGRAYKKVESS